MIRRSEAFALLLALVPLPALATVFSGEVQVADAQDIFTPPSMSSPVVLRYYVADGSKVDRGDVLLRIDAGPAETQLRTLQAQLQQTTAKNAKDVADLELKQADAELALADAQADRDTAAVDALIPTALISALDYDRYQGEMQRTEHALLVKKLEVARPWLPLRAAGRTAISSWASSGCRCNSTRNRLPAPSCGPSARAA